MIWPRTVIISAPYVFRVDAIGHVTGYIVNSLDSVLCTLEIRAGCTSNRRGFERLSYIPANHIHAASFMLFKSGLGKADLKTSPLPKPRVAYTQSFPEILSWYEPILLRCSGSIARVEARRTEMRFTAGSKVMAQVLVYCFFASIEDFLASPSSVFLSFVFVSHLCYPAVTTEIITHR